MIRVFVSSFIQNKNIVIDLKNILGAKTMSKKNNSVTKNMVCNHNKFIRKHGLIMVCNHNKYIKLHLYSMICNHNKYMQLYIWSKVWNNTKYNPNI